MPAIQDSPRENAGELGYFGRGDMQKDFEDAALVLQPDDISVVVETASGLHSNKLPRSIGTSNVETMDNIAR